MARVERPRARAVALILNTAGAKSIKTQLPITASVLQIKRAVERAEGIKPSLQSVYFGEREDELQNKERLNELGIDGQEPICMNLVIKKAKEFTVEVTLKNYASKQTYASAKEAAAAAWQICEERELEMPAEEWQIKHSKWGWQSSYNLMVPAGDDWEPDEVFKKYVGRRANHTDGVVLDNDGEAIKAKAGGAGRKGSRPGINQSIGGQISD